MSGGITLTHLIEVESARRGLTKNEMVLCIAEAIKTTYARRGHYVSVEIVENPESGDLSMNVRKLVFESGSTVGKLVLRP